MFWLSKQSEQTGNNQTIIYLKTTDGGGYANVTAYKTEPYQSEAQASNTSELEKRIKKLEDIIYESNISNASESGTKQSAVTD